jgi:hypothetical protein
LIFVPNDSSAARAAYGAPNRIAIIRSHFMMEAARSWVEYSPPSAENRARDQSWMR